MSNKYDQVPKLRMYIGDIIEQLQYVDDNSFHAVLTDPPYGLSSGYDYESMIKSWLDGIEYRHEQPGYMNLEWDTVVPGPHVWSAIKEKCKPGAILMAYCGTKTADLTSLAIRLGGWQKMDEVSVLTDRISWVYPGTLSRSVNLAKSFDKREGAEGEILSIQEFNDFRNGHGREYGANLYSHSSTKEKVVVIKRKPASDNAKTWQGHGTSFTASNEVVLVFKNPVKLTSLDTALKHNTGTLNFAKAKKLAGSSRNPRNAVGVFDDPDKNIKNHFFCIKPNRKEKELGLSEQKNTHPTVKPIELNKYLASLLTPPDNVLDKCGILVPYSGSGSEFIGAMLAGWKNITAIEKDENYVELSVERYSWWLAAMQAMRTTEVKKLLTYNKDMPIQQVLVEE